MRTGLIVSGLGAAVVALTVGCAGPQITTFTLADRLNDQPGEGAAQPAGGSARQKLTVAIPSAVAWVAYTPKGKTGIRTERTEVWASSEDEVEDRLDALEDQYDDKSENPFAMDVAEDFGVAMEPLVKRYFGAHFKTVEVTHQQPAGGGADLTVSLCQLTAPIPTDKAFVALCATPSSGGTDLEAVGSSPVKSAAGHLAWVIPGMILTFPIGVYFFGQALRGVTHDNGEDGTAIALDAATGDLAERYAEFLQTGRVKMVRPVFKATTIATITAEQRKSVEDGVTTRAALESELGEPSMLYEVAGRPQGCEQFAQYYAKDGAVLSLVYKRDGSVCAHQ